MSKGPRIVEFPTSHAKELDAASQDAVATLQYALEQAREGKIDGLVIMSTDPKGHPSIVSTPAIDLAQLNLAWDVFKYELLFCSEED